MPLLVALFGLVVIVSLALFGCWLILATDQIKDSTLHE